MTSNFSNCQRTDSHNDYSAHQRVIQFTNHNTCFYYIPITDTTLELSVFWPSDTESLINGRIHITIL